MIKTKHLITTSFGVFFLAGALVLGGNITTNNFKAAEAVETPLTSTVNNYYAIIDNSSGLMTSYPTNWEYKKDVHVQFNDSIDMTWLVSFGRRTGTNMLALGNINDLAGNYENDVQVSAEQSTITAVTDTNSDYFKIAQALGYEGETTKFVSAVISDGYIENVQDFHFYFSGAEAGYVTVLYQEEGESNWTVVKTDDGEKSYYGADGSNKQGSGVTGSWNQSAYHNGSTWFFTNTLQGKTAKIAFTYEAYTPRSNNLYLRGIEINTLNSAISYVDKLSSETGICEKITNNTSNYKSNLELINYKITQADLEALSEKELNSENTSEKTYYDFYSYLLDYAGIENSDPLGINSPLTFINDKSGVVTLTLIGIVVVAVFTVGLLIVINKKRHYNK